MEHSNLYNRIFGEAIADYHQKNQANTPMKNPYQAPGIEYYLYTKNWIDTVQWHLEDLIRDTNINPVEALALKCRIEHSNQDQTNLIELIDNYFLDTYKNTVIQPDTTINTESPALYHTNSYVFYNHLAE